MRRSSALATLLGGIALAVTGVGGAAFAFGSAFLGARPSDEPAVGVALGVVALAVAAFGVWLVRYGKRAWDARIAELRAGRVRPPAGL